MFWGRRVWVDLRRGTYSKCKMAIWGVTARVETSAPHNKYAALKCTALNSSNYYYRSMPFVTHFGPWTFVYRRIKDGSTPLPNYVWLRATVTFFQPPAPIIWMFWCLVRLQLEYVSSFPDHVTHLPPGSNRSVEQFFFAPSRSQIFAPVKTSDKSGCVPAQTRWTLLPLMIYFCSSGQGKGKNCKIRQEFCLWGARTQLPVGAGNGRECHKKSCDLWHFQMVNTLVCSHMYIDCQIQKHDTGASHFL